MKKLLSLGSPLALRAVLGGALVLSGMSTLSGCTPIVDDALTRVDAGDPPPVTEDPCRGLDDGTICRREGIDSNLICRDERCSSSRCGDGILDARAEACDDGNSTFGDGCEPDCTVTPGCETDSDCETSTNPCLLALCDHATATCSIEPRPNNADCSEPGGPTFLCRGGSCVSASCGDNALSVDAGEVCDDGNTIDGDGCSSTCQPECRSDDDCRRDVCSIVERCVIRESVERGRFGSCEVDPTITPLSCASPCQTCSSTLGMCVPSAAADRDGDGHANYECGGDDCDDSNPNVHPGHAEICANGVDDNCNGDGDEGTATTYYVDCDRDGFAAADAGSVSSCVAPRSGPAACPTFGYWTTRAPSAGSTDCNDADENAYPGQRAFFSSPSSNGSFDYDCNGVEEAQYTRRSNPRNPSSCNLGGCTGPSLIAPSEVCGQIAARYDCNGLGGDSCDRSLVRVLLACR